MESELLPAYEAFKDRRLENALQMADHHLVEHKNCQRALLIALPCLLGLGRYEEFVYRARLVEPGPNLPTVMAMEATCLSALGRRDDALNVASWAVREGPDTAVCHLTLSRLLLSRGDPRALEGAERAVALDRRSAEAWALLAASQSLVGRGWAARWSLRRALAIDPKHERALALKARFVFLFRFGRRADEARRARALWLAEWQARDPLH